MQDLRYGARQLWQSPGFALVAVMSLALGIGANSAIFQLIDVVRLRTLPVQKPQELVAIDFAEGSQRSGWFSTRNSRFTYGQWEQVRAQQQAFTGVLAWSATRFNLTAGGEARYAEGLYVSGEFFKHLGVSPLLGRTFTAQDDSQTCGDPAAVISHAFWQREYGADAGVIGRTVSLDGTPFPVIGVTPPSFFGVEVGRGLRRGDSALRRPAAGRRQEGPDTAARRLVVGDHGASQARLDSRAGHRPSAGPFPGHHAGHPAAHLSARDRQALPGEQARRFGSGYRHLGLAPPVREAALAADGNHRAWYS